MCLNVHEYVRVCGCVRASIWCVGASLCMYVGGRRPCMRYGMSSTHPKRHSQPHCQHDLHDLMIGTQSSSSSSFSASSTSSHAQVIYGPYGHHASPLSEYAVVTRKQCILVLTMAWPSPLMLFTYPDYNASLASPQSSCRLLLHKYTDADAPGLGTYLVPLDGLCNCVRGNS